MKKSTPFHRIWQLSLLSFIIAASTGFLFRYGMLYELPEWLSFANIRHAHSHLMFFNWVSPPIMIWMVSLLLPNHQIKEIARFKQCFYLMLFLGFLSYPFFLLYGYHPVTIGVISLPLAAIVSGLVMITWYWFAWLWYRARKQVKNSNSLSVVIFDGALAALLISSLGAWGVSVFQFTPVDSPQISSALTHFFLAVFTEGWAVLGILAILWQKVDLKTIPFSSGWLWQPILFGSMLIFPFSLSENVITPAMHYTAIFGALLIAGSFGLNIFLILNTGILKGFTWKTILILMGVKILLLAATILPLNIWPGEHGLRVLYLHILLLGIVSILLINIFTPDAFSRLKHLFAGTVLTLLLTLTMISGYWPAFLVLPNLYHWIMIAAFLPIIPSLWIFFRDLMSQRSF